MEYKTPITQVLEVSQTIANTSRFTGVTLVTNLCITYELRKPLATMTNASVVLTDSSLPIAVLSAYSNTAATL